MAKKKRFRIDRKKWQYIGLVVLAATTFAVAALALIPKPTVATGPVIRPTATKSVAPAPVVAFIGDSYTSGTGATSPGNRWSTKLSRDMGWNELNLGVGGTGYFNAATSTNYKGSIQRAANAKPSLVVVSGGRNDVGYGESRFKPAVDDFFKTLRTELPDTKVVVTSPIYDDQPGPSAVDQLDADVKAAATSVGATYLDIGEPLLDHPEFVAADGVHPNDAGHAAIETAVKQVIAAVPGIKP